MDGVGSAGVMIVKCQPITSRQRPYLTLGGKYWCINQSEGAKQVFSPGVLKVGMSHSQSQHFVVSTNIQGFRGYNE